MSSRIRISRLMKHSDTAVATSTFMRHLKHWIGLTGTKLCAIGVLSRAAACLNHKPSLGHPTLCAARAYLIKRALVTRQMTVPAPPHVGPHPRRHRERELRQTPQTHTTPLFTSCAFHPTVHTTLPFPVRTAHYRLLQYSRQRVTSPPKKNSLSFPHIPHHTTLSATTTNPEMSSNSIKLLTGNSHPELAKRVADRSFTLSSHPHPLITVQRPR
jgi:hypothetical protein